MLPKNVLPPTHVAVPAKALRLIKAAVEVLGEETQVVLHRIALVDGMRVAYDLWSHNFSDEALAYAQATRGLDGHDLARPPKRSKNQLASARSAGCFAGWFYDEQCLLGRVVITTGRRPRPKALNKASALFNAAWTILKDAPPTLDSEGTLLANDEGTVLACDDSSRENLSQGTGLEGLITSAVHVAQGESVFLSGTTSISLTPLTGMLPTWLVRLGRAEWVQIAPDAPLTPTQRTIAEYAIVGATVEEIARTMQAGRETVRTHMKEIYRRLEVANRVELARALQ